MDLTKQHLAKAKAKAEEMILNDLDIVVEVALVMDSKQMCHAASPIKDRPISTSRIGMMAIIIETLTVSVDVRFDLNSRWLAVDYKMRYSHVSGGTNGNSTTKRFEIPYI